MIAAIDLETTGLDPRRDQILQIGCVLFDPERDADAPVGDLPNYSTLVRHERYQGDAYALQMNAAILLRLADRKAEGVRTLTEALDGLRLFLSEHAPGGRPTPLGFNVCAFDVAFLKNVGCDVFHHRPLELGSMFADERGPSNSWDLTASHLGREVTHDALQDARDAVELYRHWRAVGGGYQPPRLMAGPGCP